MKAFDDTRKALEEEEAIDDEFQSEVLTESQVDSMTEQLTEAILMRVTVPHARTRRNSGRIR